MWEMRHSKPYSEKNICRPRVPETSDSLRADYKRAK
jgi:hypothetical protein